MHNIQKKKKKRKRWVTFFHFECSPKPILFLYKFINFLFKDMNTALSLYLSHFISPKYHDIVLFHEFPHGKV